jgi:ankyrin repeat protein
MMPGQRDKPHLAAIWYIVSELRSLAIGLDVKDSQCWFELIAAGISPTQFWRSSKELPFPDSWTDESRKLHLLCGAVILGNEQLFTRLLGKVDDLGSIVNNDPAFFYQPLTLAASRGNTEIVRHLLLLGARLDLDVHQCSSVLACGTWVSNGDGDDQADFSLQADYVQRSVFTTRHHAALVAVVQGSHEETLELFLKHQHRLPITSLEYFRAMVAAAEVGRQDLLDRLFTAIGKSLGDVPALHHSLLCAAARGGHQSLVQLLMDSGVEIKNGYLEGGRSITARLVAGFGTTSMLRYLLEKGVLAKLPDESGNYPWLLDLAAREGRIEAVHLLLDYGADPQLALSHAAGQVRLPLIKSLMKRYPELLRRDNWDCGRRALSNAVKNNARLETITFFVDAGVPLNDGYKKPSCTPLNLAKDDRNVPMIVIDHLLALGAHPTDSKLVPRFERMTDKFGVRISEASREWTCLY